VGALTPEQLDAAAEDAIAQAQAQGAPRTVESPAILERLSSHMGELADDIQRNRR
jgi:hypothetical protein